VGRSEANYQVRALADLVQRAVRGSRVTYAPGGGPDPRSYRVDCSKLAATLPEFRPQWTVPQGIAQLCEAYRTFGLTREDFCGSRFLRVLHIQELQREGRVDSALRWQHGAGERTAADAVWQPAKVGS